MNEWTTKYTDDSQTSRFVDERDYVDFTFIMIVLYNFKTLLMPEDLDGRVDTDRVL